MTYEEALVYVDELRGRFDAFSTHDKQLIEQLYMDVLDKKFKRTSCKDCYRDAYIEITNYLKREKKMKEKCKYKLRAGFVIHDFKTGRIFTNANLTDKIAKDYLKAFPKQRKMFETVPEEEEEEVVFFNDVKQK